MTKQNFLDQAIMAMLSNSEITSKFNIPTLWRKAEEIWSLRTKEERKQIEKRDTVSDSEKEALWGAFWNNYDKKVGTNKAKDKFMSIAYSELEVIVEAAYKYAKSTPEVQYRKNPITWLNQKCWLDSLPEDGNKKPNIGLV